MNVADRLSQMANRDPRAVAVVEQKVSFGRPARYRQCSFGELESDSTQIARELVARGVRPGDRLVLLVPPGIDFVSLVYALLKSAAVLVLIDPGIDRQHLLDCLTEVEPDGFVAVPRGQLARIVYRRRFPKARHNITVGGSALWPGPRLANLRQGQSTDALSAVTENDPAAVIFTSGSTGPPKGVLYRHGNFTAQVEQIGGYYDIRAGEIDVACFPLFALFNAAMGATTVFPQMDFTRPADANPDYLLQAFRDQQATQAFGSPALWSRVGTYCEQQPENLPKLNRILSAGAPVPAHVLRRMRSLLATGGEMYTPYGATEALPIASISASEVLAKTQTQSDEGAGTCVGSRFPGIEWRVVSITDGPLSSEEATPLAPGEIGELIVRGPVVTTEYVTKLAANELAKIRDASGNWHRMGDVGYLDEQDRFWYCGRKAHRVTTQDETLFSIPCEAILNRHASVYRSALVGVGPCGQQRPILAAEVWPEKRPANPAAERQLMEELRMLVAGHAVTRRIETVLLHPQLPVDIRHNSKIFREKVAVWAEQQTQRR